MMALGHAKRLSEMSVAELLEARYDAGQHDDKDKIDTINEILKDAERRERNRQEIRELEKLTLMKSNTGIPNFSGALSHFKASLAQNGINNPKKHILDTLVRQFPMQMALAAGDANCALNLYEDMQALPSTTTSERLKEEAKIYLNGPAGPANMNVLIGSRSDKMPVIVKILVATGSRRKLSYSELSAGCRKEASVCERLGLSSTTFPFVQSEVFDISDTTNGVCRYAIVMPMYVRTVADSARLWPASLIDGSQRMAEALKYMHSLNLVHMDVKGSNIFIDQRGDWFLGDFGSARDIGEAVVTTTPSFYPTNLCGLPALPKYDWFMLLVAILIELMPKKQAWAKELCELGTNVVTFARVERSLVNAMSSADVSEPLKSVLSDIATRAELPLPPPPPSSPA